MEARDLLAQVSRVSKRHLAKKHAYVWFGSEMHRVRKNRMFNYQWRCGWLLLISLSPLAGYKPNHNGAGGRRHYESPAVQGGEPDHLLGLASFDGFETGGHYPAHPHDRLQRFSATMPRCVRLPLSAAHSSYRNDPLPSETNDLISDARHIDLLNLEPVFKNIKYPERHFDR